MYVSRKSILDYSNESNNLVSGSHCFWWDFQIHIALVILTYKAVQQQITSKSPWLWFITRLYTSKYRVCSHISNGNMNMNSLDIHPSIICVYASWGTGWFGDHLDFGAAQFLHVWFIQWWVTDWEGYSCSLYCTCSHSVRTHRHK